MVARVVPVVKMRNPVDKMGNFAYSTNSKREKTVSRKSSLSKGNRESSSQAESELSQRISKVHLGVGCRKIVFSDNQLARGNRVWQARFAYVTCTKRKALPSKRVEPRINSSLYGRRIYPF